MNNNNTLKNWLNKFNKKPEAKPEIEKAKAQSTVYPDGKKVIHENTKKND
jgi:hypothetical protein